MEWATPQYSRQQVNAAGRLVASVPRQIVMEWTNDDWSHWRDAIDVLNNWRSSHSYPLNTFQVNLRRSARRYDRNALVGQRLKRFFSIARKLRRFEKMKLSQMQDIGGCRAVLNSSTSAQKLCDYYKKVSNIKHALASEDDYINNPKNSGYRGLHLVYRYFSDRDTTSIYNGLKIEMQIRSLYQHAWATAVETVDTFTDQALKSSLGDKEWERFFALMGTAIALREKLPPVPGTPNTLKELRPELDHYAAQLNVLNRLSTYSNALRALPTRTENARYYLLQLDSATGELTVRGYRWGEMDEASQKYKEVEETIRDKPGTDAVLVSVDSLAALERTYPNYFADTGTFVQLLRQTLSGHQRRIFSGPSAFD